MLVVTLIFCCVFILVKTFWVNCLAEQWAMPLCLLSMCILSKIFGFANGFWLFVTACEVDYVLFSGRLVSVSVASSERSYVFEASVVLFSV